MCIRDRIEYWQESGDSKYLDYRTKDIDFGEPGLKKKIYKVVISHKGGAEDLTVYYGKNGSSTVNGQFNSTATPLSYSSDWTSTVLIPSTTSDANNIYSFQLKIASGAVSASSTLGVSQGVSSTSITLGSSASSDNDEYDDKIIRITDNTGIGQSRRISAYNGTTKVATVASTWTTNPPTGSNYEIGWVDSNFAINDITIFYRLKPPGAGA